MLAADIQHNIDDIERWLTELAAGFNFTMRGEDQSLGRDLAGVVAQGIIDRTIAHQQDATGGGLKALSEAYRKRKLKEYGLDDILFRTGQMLSLESVLGDLSLSPEEVQMTYGTGDPPARGAGPMGKISDQDKEVTDREKAAFAHESDRPFYGLDTTIADDVAKAAAEALGSYLKEG